MTGSNGPGVAAESNGQGAAAREDTARSGPPGTSQGPYGPEAGAPIPPDADPGVDLRDVARESALISLFDGYHAQLVRLAVLLGAEQDAEDVVAEAFCVLHHRWYRLRAPDAAPAYLRSVVCNLVRMRIRRLQVSRRHASVEVSDIDSAESTAMLHEDQRQVVDALKQLPGRQREALVLRYWMDLKEREIAEAMGISAGTVKSHISRGMEALSRALETHR
ncbi:sigma-70 family RNA polymerase sigma factor [Streptomyces armeniacus]|uniref:Sigma-70 family RNA polymerase sigma factor n=1 Tax=Streptomyces armeniacus TaxID=83291 RepID=A0A345Y1M8_9ACTN|nr:sigma-70 family RNA polymerase sigma factor [Streptomyces armeniacus]